MSQHLKLTKKATVSIVAMDNSWSGEAQKGPPFEIIGSGFCVHERGVIATCAHVLEAFVHEADRGVVQHMKEVVRGNREAVIHRVARISDPWVIFYYPNHDFSKIRALACPVEYYVIDAKLDMAMIRIKPGVDVYEKGYPFVELADYGSVHEGMEVGVLGFPRGNKLQEEYGTVMSSMAKGVVSAISPAEGVNMDHLKGYQLDLRATHGYSGGPVFDFASGKVIGILQGGIPDDYGVHLFSKAEPVHSPAFAEMVGQVLDGSLTE